MRAVVFAYHDVGYAGLSEILAQRDQVLAVFTHDDDPHENVWFHSVAELARRHGIPVHTPADVNTPEWIGHIRALAPDIIFSFYYRRMIAPEILAIPPKGALNLHGSLLPRYRGRAPINWVLVKGETETGVTLHHMVEKPDAGDIVAQRRVAIDFEDTAFTLFHKLTAAAEGLMHDTLPLLRAGTAPRTPMDLARGNYVRGRKPADGLIDWSWEPLRIYNLVRAVTHPYPGAFTFAGGKKLLVWQAHPLDAAGQGPVGAGLGPAGAVTRPTAAPGEIVASDPASGVSIVRCDDGLLRLERVQFEGDAEGPGSLLPAGTQLGGGPA